MITHHHRRLKGFAPKTFHSASLISCGLQCQRNPRCVSTNFKKVSKTEGTCELNDRGVYPPEEGKELEYDEEAIYTQFYFKKVTKMCLSILSIDPLKKWASSKSRSRPTKTRWRSVFTLRKSVSDNGSDNYG